VSFSHGSTAQSEDGGPSDDDAVDGPVARGRVRFRSIKMPQLPDDTPTYNSRNPAMAILRTARPQDDCDRRGARCQRENTGSGGGSQRG
jgi:hypothetical protein